MDERITGLLQEIMASPLSVEIIYSAIMGIAQKAGYSNNQVYEDLFEALLDWDK